MTAKIHGAEYPVRKIFSNDFVFRVPLYQRPYSWTTEHAGELPSDLLDFIGQGNAEINLASLTFHCKASAIVRRFREIDASG